ncbi:DUF2242 domain-containing protein [Pseudomonas sp. SORT22]|uniref:DUF2242 domain-containing protein n=1 Tax=unclassified Pseudomonas TaxID=196821 RepID=UPI0008872449|nr:MULTISPECIES: DUF2242 domain-containing protein [unclassified Pseudomonas]QVM98246.1 DUF2242 domain-containing protein [Pseudomonas sp. SORT22]SDQ52187.1 hypothetical protein SAMN05216487_2297 [Pseudomonas sp. UC 17F4]
MSKSTVCGALGLALVLAGVSGCSSKKAAIYEHENFDDSGTFSRSFAVSEAGTCEAARRALLSQGYIITSSDAGQVNGNKSFQQTGDSHLQISFNVVCARDSGDEQRSTMFANALQDRYALKKSNTSASLGVGVLGSVSMPIGSSDDSMVKVASETVTSAKFYERYFALVESFLPKETKKKAEAKPAAKPAVELGVPETAPAAPAAALAPAPVEAPAAGVPVSEPSPAPAAEVPAAPVVDDSSGSQPVPPPAEAAPISVQDSSTPAPVEPTPTIAPVAPASSEQAPL